MNTNKKIEISFPNNVDEEELRTKLDEFLCGVFPSATMSVSTTTTCGGRSKHSKRAPLKEINNVVPKRRRIVVPPINQDPSSNLIKGPVVFGKLRVPSNCNPEECPPNKPDKEPEPEAIEDRCIYCGQGPCIASGSFRCIGARRADIRNYSFRHKDYRSYWKSLKDCGFWQCPQYLERKTAAGIPEEELREIMPVCVLKDVRNRYANPPGVPYMGHKRF